MPGVVSIGIIMLLRVIQHYFGKRTSTVFPTSAVGRSLYVAVSMGLSAVFALASLLIDGNWQHFSWLNVWLSTVSGLALAGSTLCSNLAMKSGTIALTSVFGTAGLLVPCIAGILFFDEPMSLWQWLGVAVFIFASWLLSRSAKSAHTGFSWKTVLLLLGSMLTNGITMLCQKLLTFTDPQANVLLFSFLSFGIPAVVFLLMFGKARRDGQKEALDRRLYVPIVLLALAVFLINQLATDATRTVDSVILFACINGGSSIIAAIVGAICYRERPTVQSALGLLLGVAALIVINAL